MPKYYLNSYRIWYLLLAYMILSCSPSKEERALAQKVREDSIRVAAERSAMHIVALKDSIDNTLSSIEATENRLIVRKADLAAATDKLNVIKRPQFLRTPEEREQQVRTQMIVIQNLENDVIKLAYRLEKKKQLVTNLRTELANLK